MANDGALIDGLALSDTLEVTAEITPSIIADAVDIRGAAVDANAALIEGAQLPRATLIARATSLAAPIVSLPALVTDEADPTIAIGAARGANDALRGHLIADVFAAIVELIAVGQTLGVRITGSGEHAGRGGLGLVAALNPTAAGRRRTTGRLTDEGHLVAAFTFAALPGPGTTALPAGIEDTDRIRAGLVGVTGRRQTLPAAAVLVKSTVTLSRATQGLTGAEPITAASLFSFAIVEGLTARLLLFRPAPAGGDEESDEQQKAEETENSLFMHE